MYVRESHLQCNANIYFLRNLSIDEDLYESDKRKADAVIAEEAKAKG